MAAAQDKTICIDVDSVAQIFNAFDADPFSAVQGAALGEAAFDHVLARLQLQPLRDWENAQLLVRLPPDQITPGLGPQLAEAIARYCRARIEENDLQVRLSRRQHAFGMVVVTLLVLAVIALAYLLFTTVLAGTADFVKTLVAASISVFAWVILWDPLEALLFEWAPPARENRALAHIMNMQVAVEGRP